MMWNTNVTVFWDLQIKGQLGKEIYSLEIHSDQTQIPTEAGRQCIEVVAVPE